MLNQLFFPNVIIKLTRKVYPFKALPITKTTKIFTFFDTTLFIKTVVTLLAR